MFGRLSVYQAHIVEGTMVGLGIATMHYTGMLAMEMQANVQWDWTTIIIPIVIAIVASIVALWLAVHVSRMWQVGVSALVMGIAVCGMHYTGMEAADFMYDAKLPYIEPMMASSDLFVLGIYCDGCTDFGCCDN
jgi:NO-binding membrane sensor protein with MHYT domain